MADCQAIHPEFQERCILGGNHPNHLCRPEHLVVPVQWTNDDFVPPPAKKQWQPKPARQFSFGEMKDIQAEANHYAAQETARLEQTMFRSTDPKPLASQGTADRFSLSAATKERILLELYSEAGESRMADSEAAERAVRIAVEDRSAGQSG